jgi:hypothetical protein
VASVKVCSCLAKRAHVVVSDICKTWQVSGAKSQGGESLAIKTDVPWPEIPISDRHH